ncbi:MAG: DMT family transporter [Rhodospirillales bacterium]|nr:DMT family transporter [Rhodospirillales bacterium]
MQLPADPPAPAGRARLSPWLILLVPPLCWAGNFVIGRAVHADIPPAALTFWRWAVAALALLPLAGADAWSRRRLILRHWRFLSVLAVSGVVGFQFFVYQGLQTTTAINGVLIIATIPVAIPIIAFALDGAKVTRRQAVGIALSLLGVAVVVLRGDPRLLLGLHLAEGDLWMFLAVPAWGLYSVVLRRRPAELPPLTLLLATILPGLLLLTLGWGAELALRGGFTASWPLLASILYVGLIASVLAFACWNHGVEQVGAAKAGLYIHLMPVFAAMLAMAFLGETLRGYHFAGVAAIAAGIWLSSTAGRNRT